MNKRTGILIFLSAALMYGTQIFAEEIREIKTLDEINQRGSVRKNTTKSLSDTEIKLQPLEKLNISDKKEEVKSETIDKATTENKVKLTDAQKALQRKDVRIIDISKKHQGADNLVYVQGEDKPFTGEFALFLGDIIEYSEAYKDGKLNGDKVWYSDKGKIAMTESYVDEKLNGEQRSYYSDGNIKAITKYKNNRIIGIEFFAQNGKLLHKSDMSTGTGEWKFYWNNGNILEEGRYKNWVKDGTWKRYQEDGTVDSIAVYENGRLKSQTWN